MLCAPQLIFDPPGDSSLPGYFLTCFKTENDLSPSQLETGTVKNSGGGETRDPSSSSSSLFPSILTAEAGTRLSSNVKKLLAASRCPSDAAPPPPPRPPAVKSCLCFLVHSGSLSRAAGNHYRIEKCTYFWYKFSSFLTSFSSCIFRFALRRGLFMFTSRT